MGTQIPGSIYERIPRLFAASSEHLEQPYERDVLLTGSIPVVANALTNVVGNHADGYVDLNLYAIIVAPPGSGKGILRIVRQLGTVVDQRYRETVNNDSEESDDDGGEKVSSTVAGGHTFFLPGNSSVAGLIERLSINKGRGLFFETEIRPVSNALKSDGGDFRDILLKGFQQEYVEVSRKGRCTIIHRPALSFIATGTAKDIPALFVSLEDGLFSRFMFYQFETPRKWISKQPGEKTEALTKEIHESAITLDKINQVLENRDGPPIIVSLEDEEWEFLNGVFKIEFEDKLGPEDDAFEASVKRSGHIAFRIACIFAVIRSYEEGVGLSSVSHIMASRDDVEAAVSLATLYLSHAKEIADTLLPGAKLTGKEQRQQKFLELLPDGIFTTATAEQICQQMGLSASTAKHWLPPLIESGILIQLRHGHYIRAGGASETEEQEVDGEIVKDGGETVNDDDTGVTVPEQVKLANAMRENLSGTNVSELVKLLNTMDENPTGANILEVMKLVNAMRENLTGSNVPELVKSLNIMDENLKVLHMSSVLGRLKMLITDLRHRRYPS